MIRNNPDRWTWTFDAGQAPRLTGVFERFVPSHEAADLFATFEQLQVIQTLTATGWTEYERRPLPEKANGYDRFVS